MDILYERCGGIDVHKKIIVVSFRCGRKETTRSFGSTSEEIRKMVKWLQEEKCEIVAMESTGSYWKPLFNIFEVSNIEVMVVNARHCKNVPGRKTDTNDAQWIAELLQHGLLKKSFIPSREQRDLRDLSRYRISLVEERAREINRLQKMLEGGNIKLASVVSNINGKSSRNLLKRALVSDELLTEEEILENIQPNMYHKSELILKALDGFLTPIQKQLILRILAHIDDMTKRIEEMDSLIKSFMSDYEEAIQRIDAIPGIARRSAETILIEIGLDMSYFPSGKCLARWSGLAPGNDETAKKQRNGKTTKGNKTLKTTLVQCAKVARKKSGSFLKAQYQRLAPRRGSNRATVAVAHSMIIAIYNMLKNNEPYRDLGEGYYNNFNREQKINRYLKKLKQLGWEPEMATMSCFATGL